MPPVTTHVPRIRSATYAAPSLWQPPDRLSAGSSVLVIASLSGGLWLVIVRGVFWLIS